MPKFKHETYKLDPQAKSKNVDKSICMMILQFSLKPKLPICLETVQSSKFVKQCNVWDEDFIFVSISEMVFSESIVSFLYPIQEKITKQVSRKEAEV